MANGNAGKKQTTSSISRLVQGAPRYPLWQCGQCNCPDNWGDRSSCRRCHATAPPAVQRRQREAVQGRKHGGGGGGTSSGGANRDASSGGAGGAAGGGGGGSGGRPGGKGQPTSPTTGSRSYAEVAASAARSSSISSAAELAELRRSNERLVKQVAELRSAQTTTTTTEKDDDEEGEAEDGGEEERDERIRLLQAHIKSVATVFGEGSAEHSAKKCELETLLKSRREGKPLKVQLQASDRRIEKLKSRVARGDARVGQICTRIADLRDELEVAERELDDDKSQLSQAEEERKMLLLREAKAAQADVAPEPAEAAKPYGEAEWARIVGIIGERTAQPGVHAELASQIGTALQMLHNLCSQLPAPAAPPTTAAGGNGNAPAAGGGAPATCPNGDAQQASDNTRQLAREMATQVRRDVAPSASTRPAEPAAAGQSPAPPTPQPWPLPPAAATPSTMAVDECGAPAGVAATEAGRQRRQALEQQHAAAAAAAPAAGASAVEAAGGDANRKGLDDADDSDDLTEDEDAGVRFVEEALQATPAELQDQLRAILDRRKKRLEQVRSGPRRLKRAGRRSDRSGAEGSDPKKPLK